MCFKYSAVISGTINLDTIPIPRHMLISTATLSSILGDPRLLIIDARSFAEYSKGHIPGAVNLDLFAFHWIDTTAEGIKNFERQAATLFAAVGAEGKKVVLYDNVSGMLAARGLWMLMYMSHPDVAMLDGGITKWRNDGLQIETGTNRFKPSRSFSGSPNPELVIGFEEIRDNLERLEIVDARSPEEYYGSVVRAASAGHIPTSLNIDWNLNLSEDGTFKNPIDLSALYRMPRDSQIVTYCHGGYRAAHSFLALRMAGFKNVRVYLGSWGEWGNNVDLPVE